MSDSHIDVSVVLPVYNAGNYLKECLESLISQELGGLGLEIIAVNDGSTDGSGELLDTFAERVPGLTVIHQDNSGGPGKPRNVGLDKARGRYVFFCDADDYLGHESLSRLVSFADEHGSDLVIPKLVGVNGRWIRKSIYRQTQIDADLFRASQSSGPTKLFRRSVIEQNALRFPEGKVPAEDTIFLFRMFSASKRVSILADYDYYFVRLRDDSGNTSFRPTDPFEYARSLMTAMKAIENRLPSRAIERALMLELFRRVGLNKYAENYAKASAQRQVMWVDAHRDVVAAFLPPGSEMALRSPERERLALIREGRVADLVKLATLPRTAKIQARMRSVKPAAAGLGLHGTVRMENGFRRFDSIRLELSPRELDGTLVYRSHPGQLKIEAGQSEVGPEFEVFTVLLDGTILNTLPSGVWDVYVVVSSAGAESRTRLAVGTPAKMRAALKAGRLITPYATVHGNLSLKITKRQPAVGKIPRRALRAAKKTLRARIPWLS